MKGAQHGCEFNGLQWSFSLQPYCAGGGRVRVQRCYRSGKTGFPQKAVLHAFADASPMAGHILVDRLDYGLTLGERRTVSVEAFYVESVHRDTSHHKLSIWRHCPGSGNPAHHMTQGFSSQEIVDSSVGCKGPRKVKITESFEPNHSSSSDISTAIG
ncbi:hypothetical protein HPB48_023011 [Haemaphysalis longicornis]|uniref:Uncharacterized protein n=1 Tax=Haemaphysalis longicornis TaxID=44386 RepID=A0A9J6FQB7_HAELO|nr:hypothetical protein HPB48_023011 [Haemaphysalis longicornis]